MEKNLKICNTEKYYPSRGCRGKEMSLSCDLSLYYKLPKSDPSVVYLLPTQNLMLFIWSQFISMEIVQHQLDCSTNNKHIN